MRLLIFGLSLIFISFTAQATEGFSTGKDLKDWCDKMDQDDTAWGLCVGSITAAHDMVMTYQNAADVKKVICLPKGGTRGDSVNAVRDYIRDHPDELIYSLGDFVFGALANKFPCR